MQKTITFKKLKFITKILKFLSSNLKILFFSVRLLMEKFTWWLRKMFLYYTKPSYVENILPMDIVLMEWDANLSTIPMKILT